MLGSSSQVLCWVFALRPSLAHTNGLESLTIDTKKGALGTLMILLKPAFSVSVLSTCSTRLRIHL